MTDKPSIFPKSLSHSPLLLTSTVMEPTFHNNSSLSILLPLLIAVLLSSRLVTAQSPPPPNSNSQYGYFQPRNFTSSILIIVVLLITGFFLFGFFSVVIRQCTSEVVFEHGPGMQTPIMNRQPRGLDRAVIRTLPVMLYSEVKKHKVGKRALECAVCLSEFEDEDMLRLLPKCSHAFHPDCIDPWFEGHVTCPVCRCNLKDYKSEETSPYAGTLDYEGSLHRANQITLREEERSMSPESPLADHMVIQISTETEDERRDIEEMTELLRIRTMRRAARPKSSWRPPRFPRSHSTGHSLSRMCHTGDEPDHYTLRIPEHVLRQIIAEGGLKRSTSLVALKEMGDGSSRPTYRNGGEGSSRGGRSVMMFVRDISGRFAAWGMGRRGNGEGSVKGDGSTVRV